MRARTLEVVVALAFAACLGPSASESAHRAPVSADAEVPASPEPSSEPGQEPATNEAGEAGALKLPVLDASCQVDADCGILARALEGEQQCCSNPCGYAPHHAGNLAWIAAVEAACEPGADARSHCPVAFACPGQLLGSPCVDGQCVLEAQQP